jgi:hypothetical protein
MTSGCVHVDVRATPTPPSSSRTAFALFVAHRVGRHVVPVEVGAGEGRVGQELVERLVPAGLPESLLLDVERREEGVDAAGARGHLDGELLAGLELRQGLPLDLHAGQGLELGDVLLEHLDPGVLGEDQVELLALEALPVEALGAGGGEDERPGGGARDGGGGAGAEHRPARERRRGE